MCCNPAAVGGIVRRNTGLLPPSTIAGTDGRAAPSGADCSRLCARSRPTRFTASTRRRPRRIARRPAEKGGGSASYRPLPRRANDQDPRRLRRARARHRHRGDTGPARRRSSRRAASRSTAAEPEMRGRHGPSSPTTRRASVSTPSTARPISDATSSSEPSAASKTGDVSRPATTSSHATFTPQPSSQQSSFGGSD